jgi:hypothetical protein
MPPAALRNFADPSNPQLQVIEGRRKAHWWRLILGIVGAILGLALISLAIFVRSQAWPFSEKAVVQDLKEASDSSVTIRGFHSTYFPFPGCTLEGIEITHGDRKFKLITIDKLLVQGTYPGILIHHVAHLIIVGTHILVPPFGSNVTFRSQHSDVVVDEIVADGTTLEFARRDADSPALRFDIHEALFNDVRWGAPFQYQVKVHNPLPPGEITAKGKFGGWTTGHPGDTPVSGEYTFEGADLGVYEGIAGTLSSAGKFGGVLQHIDITGRTQTPDFEVTSGGHQTALTTQFDAFVDAIHGDTFLKRVEAKLGRTTVTAEGSVAGVEGRDGKVARIKLTTRRGRIEDLMVLFTSDRRSPMSGEVSLHANVEIPSGDQPFLDKVKLDGGFGISDGSFAKADTQTSVDTLSAGARGQNKDDPETVLTDLQGIVALKRRVATFSDLSFGVPGADARMKGTYNIGNSKIDLHGTMRVDTKISQTTTGAKALLLKVMDPLFKKKKKGEIIPVHIAGTYKDPAFGLDLTSSKSSPPAK